MEIVSEEIDSRLTQIGPWHISTFDEDFSTLFIPEDAFYIAKLFPVSITKYSLEHSSIIEFLDLYIPEHGLILFCEFLKYCHTLSIPISL
jgi:hypothetical protein